MIPAPVTIGTHRYVVDLAKVIRRPISSIRQQVDQGGEPSEQTLDTQALWKRTQSDFILGQGQVHFDQEQESNRRRFRAGRAIDPLSKRRSMVSTPTMAAVETLSPGAGNGGVILRTADNWWSVGLAGSGAQTFRSSSLNTTPDAQAITGAGAATDATVFGDTVYIATGSGVVSGSTTGTSVSSFSTEDVDVIDAALGRLVCGHDGDLFELDNTGTRIDIFTHPNPQWSWTDFCTGNAGIYCAGTDGGRSELYLITVIDADGALAPPYPVGELPAGEIIYCIEFFGGILAIGTNRGVRIAQASQAGLLTYGPLVELNEVRGIQFDGRFLYAACSYMPEWLTPGIVRLAVDRFTAPLTPAFAGGWRIIDNDPLRVWDVGVYEDAYYGRTYVYAITGNTSSKLFFTSALGTRDTGEFWSGLITYGTPEPKTWRSIEIDCTITGTGVLTAQLYDYKGGTLYGTATSTGTGRQTVTVTPTSEMRTETAELYLSLAGNATETDAEPVEVHRWTSRAVPSPRYLAEELILPLQLAREVLADTGQIVQYDAEAEWQYLTGLMRSREEVTVEFGNEQITAWVDQLGVEGGWYRWDVRTEWPEGTVFIRLLSLTET